MIDWWGLKINEYYGLIEGLIIIVVIFEEWFVKLGSLGKFLFMVEVMVVKEDGSCVGLNEEGMFYFKNQMGIDFEYYKDLDKIVEVYLEFGVFIVGDVGYFDDEGLFFMSDCKIDMIIFGGVNIYFKEIEGVIVIYLVVVDVVVFGIFNEEFGEEIKVVVELVVGVFFFDELVEELVVYCWEYLVGYKVLCSIDFEEVFFCYLIGKFYKCFLCDKYWEVVGCRI